ncbi:hypothetical protein [Paraburkholderia caribensis]|uniref:hypothetical protein n=1 Tax=Paraburkholderia caribensis TaxID=75105 RepID=UPI001591F17F|nr:hypothetical protein [Paraburkholderia caribensis]
MKMILRTIFAIVITTLLVGCASGPSYDKATIYYDRQTFVETSTHDVPSIVGPVVQHGRCVLFLATPGATMAPQSFCVYALTKDALYILKWNANDAKYERLTTVFFKDIEYVALATFGRTKQVQMTERTRLIAFGALIDDGGIYDGDTGAKVFDIVKTAGVSVGKTSSIVYAPMAPVPFIPMFIK